MSNSLRDQLLGLGFKASTPERKPKPGKPAGNRGGQGKPGRGKPGAHAGKGHGRAHGKQEGRPRSQEAVDLAQAYALRAQPEKQERIAAEQARQEEARRRHQAKAKLAELPKGKATHDADAE